MVTQWSTRPRDINVDARRVHVRDGRDWQKMAGTDFWLHPATLHLTAEATNAPTLATGGWTTTSLTVSLGAGGDFGASADPGDGPCFVTNAASDLLNSPALFGSYEHMKMAEDILRYVPDKLILEWLFRFSTVVNNETATALGFVEDAGSPIVANDAMAMIFSDGTNFRIRSGAATGAAGPAVDTATHCGRIEISKAGQTAIGYSDGVLLPSVALQSDLWPAKIGGGVVAAGVNVLRMGILHVWYE
jgi:hypothetical protein